MKMMNNPATITLPTELVANLQEFRQKRQDNLEIQSRVASLHNPLIKGGNNTLSESDKQELTRLYAASLDLSQKEEELLRTSLQKVQEILDSFPQQDDEDEEDGDGEQHQEIKQVAEQQPLVASSTASPPRPSKRQRVTRSGTSEHQQSEKHTVTPEESQQQQQAEQQAEQSEVADAAVSKESDFDTKHFRDKVAARVSSDDQWILASFIKSLDRNRYEVEDDDVEAEVKKRYKLHSSRIVMLPKTLSDHKPYEKGAQVYAVFPDTTTFYPAIVDATPKHNSPYYQVCFEDDEDDDGNLQVRKISFKNVFLNPNVQQ